MPSSKESGVGLGVESGRGELLPVGVTATVGVGSAVGVAVGGLAGVAVGVGACVDDCGLHWQSKKAAMPSRMAVRHGRQPNRMRSAIELRNVQEEGKHSGFRRGRGTLERKIGRFASGISIRAFSAYYLVQRSAGVKKD